MHVETDPKWSHSCLYPWIAPSSSEHSTSRELLGAGLLESGPCPAGFPAACTGVLWGIKPALYGLNTLASTGGESRADGAWAGSTHLWRLQKARPGQRLLAVLNNLSTYVPVLSCYYSGSSCTNHIRKVLPLVLTLWSWICIEYRWISKTDYVTSQWISTELVLGWDWPPYLACLPK